MAYRQADTLVFETDVRELETPQGMQLLMQQAMAGKGAAAMLLIMAITVIPVAGLIEQSLAIAIAGASGRMGRMLVEAVLQAPDARLNRAAGA